MGMKKQKPAKGTATQADLERGFSNELGEDNPKLDWAEGYSEPFDAVDNPGFVKRNNYHERH